MCSPQRLLLCLWLWAQESWWRRPTIWVKLNYFVEQCEARGRSMLRVARIVPCSDVSGVILPWRQLLSSSVRNADGAPHMTKGLKVAEPCQKACCDALWLSSSRPTAGWAKNSDISGEEITMWSNYSCFILVLDLICLGHTQMGRDFTVDHLVGGGFLWKLRTYAAKLWD